MTDQEKRAIAQQAIDRFTNNVLSQVRDVELAEALLSCIIAAGDARLEILKGLLE